MAVETADRDDGDAGALCHLGERTKGASHVLVVVRVDAGSEERSQRIDDQQPRTALLDGTLDARHVCALDDLRAVFLVAPADRSEDPHACGVGAGRIEPRSNRVAGRVFGREDDHAAAVAIQPVGHRASSRYDSLDPAPALANQGHLQSWQGGPQWEASATP